VVAVMVFSSHICNSCFSKDVEALSRAQKVFEIGYSLHLPIMGMRHTIRPVLAETVPV